MLRRMLTLALLIAFGAPFVAPLFAATSDSQANLPACCRLHGRHHCTMSGNTSNGSAHLAFQAPPCPFYPAPAQQARTANASLAAPTRPSIQIHRDSVALFSRQRVAQITPASAHLKRGPPVRFA